MHASWQSQVYTPEILGSFFKRANMTTHASMNAYMVCVFFCLMCTRVQASGLMTCAKWNRKRRLNRHKRSTDQGHRCHREKQKNDRTIRPVMRRRSAWQFKFNLHQTSMSTIHARFQIHAKCFRCCSLTDKQHVGTRVCGKLLNTYKRPKLIFWSYRMQWVAIKFASSEMHCNSDLSRGVNYYLTHIELDWSSHHSVHIQLE